jgi:transcriptional regulator with AAA-type ATPase domain
MTLMSDGERTLAAAISKLAYCNPFLPERITCERGVLGEEFVERDTVWSLSTLPDAEHPNVARILRRVERLAGSLRQRLAEGANPSDRELELYEDVVVYLLFYRTQEQFYEWVVGGADAGPAMVTFYENFLREARRFLQVPGVRLPGGYTAAHLFACFFQVRRAFHHIFRFLVGRSMAAARLRAAVWQSIFTHDIRRYRRVLYDRMGDITTLVTGPSGTGKELVARAIALSRYIPFDEDARRFTEDFRSAFHALNLSALSPTLIESELFGHRRGAFTGALDDRVGWLEVCSPCGTVFLDEIGDVAVAIQVKLLRVLQTRTFQRLGETGPRRFAGKLIAATNRDLARRMHAGRFREDLYYRLCADIVTTPSLREQLAESPDELDHLVRYIARSVVGTEGDGLAGEVTDWIKGRLGRDYSWPGNFRELEQCVRNILIRGRYVPTEAPPADVRDRLAAEFVGGQLTAEEMLQRYCTVIYAGTENYVEAARRLGLDRRTVKSKLRPGLLDELRRVRVG